MKLIETEIQINLVNSHRGPNRLFIVGSSHWNRINRPESHSSRGKYASSVVKHHSNWVFLYAKEADSNLVMEIPILSWLLNWKYKGTLLPGSSNERISSGGKNAL